MAQAFSTALDSAFSLDSEVDDLSNSIDQKWVSASRDSASLVLTT
jgi:hypothetical protein